MEEISSSDSIKKKTKRLFIGRREEEERDNKMVISMDDDDNATRDSNNNGIILMIHYTPPPPLPEAPPPIINNKDRTLYVDNRYKITKCSISINEKLILLFRLVYRSWFQVKYKMKPFVHEDGDTIADVHEKDNNTTAISFDVSQQR